MSTDKKIIRFEKHGPANTNMSKMTLSQEDFQGELPEQTLHVYYEDADLGLSLGIWTTTDMQEAFGPYPGDEFMLVLEGQVSMEHGDGKKVAVKEGECFCIRNAIPTSWKQVGFLRKFYMTYDNPKAATPDIKSADGGVLVLDADALAGGMTVMDSTAPFDINGNAPVQKDNIAFTNDAGNMFVGMWDSTAFESEMKPFPCYEFVRLLEGDITITEGDGTVHEFTSGDMFFIPEGTVCSWKTTGYVKKFYSILDTSA